MNPKCPVCEREYPEGTTKCVFDGTDLTGKSTPNPNIEEQYKGSQSEGYQSYPPDYNQYNNPYNPNSNSRAYNRFGVNIYPKAALGKRFAAYLLDGLFSFLLAIPSTICIIIVIINIVNTIGPENYRSHYRIDKATGLEMFYDNIGLIVVAVILYIIPLVYGFIKDGLGEGQSWGKRIMGLMVVNVESNAPCSKGSSALRTLISGLIVMIPYLNFITFWIEPIMVLATDD
ncbi:MAG: RDD family protein, partial [Bacteroidota bacterium]|nr:RDD family protein [Bacteroidota bacterium]